MIRHKIGALVCALPFVQHREHESIAYRHTGRVGVAVKIVGCTRCNVVLRERTSGGQFPKVRG